MQHTIEKLNDEHWVVDEVVDVVYYNTFGKTGWYISKADGSETPSEEKEFVHAIEEAMDEAKTRKRVLPRPAGM